MTRFVAVLFALLLFGLAWLGLAGIASTIGVADQAMTMVAAVSLFVSVAAAVVAFVAVVRTNALAARYRHFVRSVDSALGEFIAERNRDDAALSSLDNRLARQLDRFSIGAPAPQGGAAGAERPAQGDNVVPHPATMRARQEQPVAVAAVVPDAEIGPALRRALSSGILELSLQPIVSITEAAAAGFEVFAHLRSEGGGTVDLRRIAEPVQGLSRSAFERLLAVNAMEAARRRLGDASETMPFHLAVSEALLGDADELAPVLDMLNRYPALTRSVVLSLPFGLVEDPGAGAPALERLASTGLRLAAEGWPQTQKTVEILKRNSVSFAKLPADRLLDRGGAAKDGVDPAALLQLLGAAGLTVIATGVRKDEGAIGLIDLGVVLMTGERFSSPRRLRPDGHAGRIARL